METFLFAFGGYLIGSIPVAYLLARKQHGIDLLTNGSGNIGARNAYEVTGNKRLGIEVLLLDMLKGLLPLLILNATGYCGTAPIVSITIILGHCYSVWLKFRGGRGLATGAGIALLITPDTLLCWVILYFLSGLIRKQVHLQSAIATIGSIVFAFVAYDSPSFYTVRFICSGEKNLFQYSTIGMLVIILSRHAQPVYQLLRKQKQ